MFVPKPMMIRIVEYLLVSSRNLLSQGPIKSDEPVIQGVFEVFAGHLNDD
jgi:hypothetical protein